MKTAVIANLNSAGGRTGKRWPEIEQAIRVRLGPVETRFTERPGHATALARELLLGGFDRIVGVGGDGTFNEIANGFFDRDHPVRPNAVLGLLPAGTGGDLQRSLELPSEAAAALDVLATGRALTIDLGRLTYESHEGETRTRYFVNLTSFGMGGEVSARAKNALLVLGGKAAFFWATLKVFAIYRGKSIHLELDGEDAGSYRVLNVAVGNGRFHGGGMCPCPDAQMHDGLFEVTVIDDLSLFTLARDARYLYNGHIYDHPKVRGFRARRVVATAAEETRIEVDGEPLGRLPIEITVLPKSLQVLVPNDSPLL